MDNRFELYAKFSEGLLRYSLDAFVGTGNKSRGHNMLFILVIILALFIFIALLYAGAETVKLLLRNNFGNKGISVTRVVISVVAFFALSYFCFTIYSDFYYEYEVYGSQESFLFASILFLSVGLIVAIKAILARTQDNEVYSPIYKGDSNILSFLAKGGWNQSTVQDLAEPLLILAFGIYFFSFNYIWGLPLIFCAISVWFHLGIEAIFGFFKDRRELSNNGYTYTQNREFSNIIN